MYLFLVNIEIKEASKNINAKACSSGGLHAFACDFVCLYLSESLDFLKINTLYLSATCVNVLQISCKPENKHS